MSDSGYVLNHYAFDPVVFLRDHWQQRPLLIRQAMIDFQDPLQPEELAGLAMESGVDSRLVVHHDQRWDVAHGPFEHFDALPEDGWSLLVQAVNEHVPDAQALLRAFRFLPDWRIDDLMVSYSTAHGGVGPHVDQYDVFIIQGQGQRRWQIGEKQDLATRLPHPDLKQTEPFTPIIDEILEPGDMIYIPAGFPHAGDTLAPAMNYSIGFRAPSQAELLSASADYALEHDTWQTRFRDQVSQLLDAERSQLTDAEPWYLPEAVVNDFQQMLQQALTDKTQIHRIVAELLSKNPRPPLPEWPESPVTESRLPYLISQQPLLFKAVGVRMLTTHLEGQLYAVVQGHWYSLDEDAEALFVVLNEMTDCIESMHLNEYLQSSRARQLLCGLLNEGLFIFSAEAGD
ncbi:cupin domain-containing protein [Aliidiomarina halalkaliphila]|uniref:Cupin domain-containing protein n=1 Tax=Aliidiomarina halalkaliphila TaxID=2593535 RepID=A0A552X4D1_9GAMM|nr:cupin domain-containing protein [Aliidiomarina halalkaliphila]TRW49769.1 cupin domain-containing protein [Aliidiomarina halalkaliphila]